MKRKRSGKMRYDYAPDLQQRMVEIVKTLGMVHIKLDKISCIRSVGSSTRRTIARCHTMGKVMQMAVGTGAYYAIEFLEPFEKLSEKDKDKTIIHELMHIPRTFGGGFRHHDHVCDENVDLMHERFESLKKSSELFD